MKKVCMFVLNPCTHDTRVLKEASTLAKAGYDVKIIAIVSEDAPDLIEEKENFTIYRVQPRAIYFYLKSIEHGIEEHLRRLFLPKTGQEEGADLKESRIIKALKVVLYPFFFLWKVAKKKIKGILQRSHQSSTYIFFWLKAKKLALSFKADVYHAHDLNTLLPAYLAAKKTGAKVVYDSHELYSERNTLLKEPAFFKWAIKKFEAFLIRRVNAVITVNESIAIELSNLYKIPVPFVIMNCPIYRLGTRNNLLREMLGLNGSQQVILYLGAITFNRGLEESITAMQKVNNGVLAVMGYGKPEYISVLKERASRLGVEEKVYFISPVPPHEVVKYAASADIGIVPIQNACKSYYYCSPNKLFESMMAGLPVAASDFPELRRVIEETNSGYLFNPSDPNSITKVLNDMICDDKTIEQMRHNALRYAYKYSWEKESKKFLLIYTGLFEN